MKTRSAKRGLYERVTTTTETDAELRDALEELSGDLDWYIIDAAQVAGEVMREAGHDPAKLFDVMDTPGGGAAVCYSLIDRDELTFDQNGALDVLLAVHKARNHDRNALWVGIRLAQAVEHFNSNRAWFKTANSGAKHIRNTIEGNRRRGDEAREYAAANWQPRVNELLAANPRLSWIQVCAKVAGENGISRSTVNRHCNDPRK